MRVSLVAGDLDRRLAMVRALDHAPRDWIVALDARPPDDVDVVVTDDTIDIPGAVRFDPATDIIDRIAARARTKQGIIVVTSASGGTGVTSVALHLAVAFAAIGRATGIVDAAPDQGIRQRLGMPPIDDEQDGRVVPVPGGFRVFEGGRALERAEEMCRRVVVDAPAGTFTELRADAEERVILIVSPSPQGARRARALAERWPDRRWHPIVNRLGRGGETTIAQLSRILDRPVLAELPCCPALRDAEDDDRLLTRPWTRWSRAIGRLAAGIDR